MAIHRDKECIVRLFRYEIRNFLVPCLSLAFSEVRCYPPIIAPAIRIHIRTGSDGVRVLVGKPQVGQVMLQIFPLVVKIVPIRDNAVLSDS